MLKTLAAQGFAGWDIIPNTSPEGFDHLFDHNEKSFTKPPQNDIISWGFIVYPGVAQLVARVVWERFSVYPRWEQPKPGTPCSTVVCGFFPNSQTGAKNGFVHINDHRQEKTLNRTIFVL